MFHVLAVATSNDSRLNSKKTGLWLSELTHFLAVLDEAGISFDIASIKGGPIPLDEKSTARLLDDPINARFMESDAFVRTLHQAMPVADANPYRYDAIYLAGGHGTMFDFRQSADLQRVITELDAGSKILSAVCHGVSGFVDARSADGSLLVAGRKVTGFSNNEDRLAGVLDLLPFLLEDALEANGAIYKKNFLPFTERVEVDGRLITGQNPASARAVGLRVVESLRCSLTPTSPAVGPGYHDLGLA